MSRTLEFATTSLRRCFSFTAHKVFDKSPERNTFIMHDKPTKYELCTALNACANTQNSNLSSQIHAKITRTGFDNNLYINSSLVNAYAKCGFTSEAMKVFNAMGLHDEVSWTSMICGLSQNGNGRQAICLFKEMLSTDTTPNSFTYASVISACTDQESAFKCGELLHTHVVITGCESNSFVISSLIDYYSKCGRMDKVDILFRSSSHPTGDGDGVVFNTMIAAYTRNQQGERALKLFVKVLNANMSVSRHTLTSILDACGALTGLQQGKQVHALVTKSGSDRNTFVAGALIDMYAKCGYINEACRVFDQTVYKSNILWTSLMTAYAHCGKGVDALRIFDQLIRGETRERFVPRFVPDHVCFTVVLTACNHAGLLDKGIGYFTQMMSQYNLDPEMDQYACLVDLYARKGDLEGARRVIEEMPYEANGVMWGCLLSGCKEYGNVEMGREAGYKLFELEPGSAVPYLILADIYAGAGLWDEVENIKRLMSENGVTKGLAGWSCVNV